jgi:flagellar assembly protein FliH
MKERRLSDMGSPILPLEYQEAGDDRFGLPLLSSTAITEPAPPVIVGVPEDEVARRIQIARDAVRAAADQQMQIERDRAIRDAQESVSAVIKEFSVERLEYFRRVEGEVVQLALSIARKILQREAELDPTLLAALVRIALDRMQCGSTVRIRVAAANAEFWRKFGDASGGSPQWEIVADETLDSGDCAVETELGSANFGFEAQLRDVEESFKQLLAHRPDERSRHAAAA